MSEYLAVYGLGACWSGYDEGRIISAASDEEAKDIAFILACNYADKESPRRGGYSYDVEQIKTDAKKTGLFKRLKLDARLSLSKAKHGSPDL